MYFLSQKKKEFNMFPYKGLKTLKHHRYTVLNVDILKMAALYGANASGKSNLVKALTLLKKTVCEEEVPYSFQNTSFKLNSKKEASQFITIEFIENDQSFLLRYRAF